MVSQFTDTVEFFTNQTKLALIPILASHGGGRARYSGGFSWLHYFLLKNMFQAIAKKEGL